VDDGFKPLGALDGDPAQLADVLYGLCKKEADATQISDEDFGRALGGDAIALATEAFVEEMFVFLSDAKIHDREGRAHRWSMASPWWLCSVEFGSAIYPRPGTENHTHCPKVDVQLRRGHRPGSMSRPGQSKAWAVASSGRSRNLVRQWQHLRRRRMLNRTPSPVWRVGH
jgi:hypothetical protein